MTDFFSLNGISSNRDLNRDDYYLPHPINNTVAERGGGSGSFGLPAGRASGTGFVPSTINFWEQVTGLTTIERLIDISISNNKIIILEAGWYVIGGEIEIQGPINDFSLQYRIVDQFNNVIVSEKIRIYSTNSPQVEIARNPFYCNENTELHLEIFVGKTGYTLPYAAIFAFQTAGTLGGGSGGVPAAQITYDNSLSGLSAVEVQSAIDELSTEVDTLLDLTSDTINYYVSNSGDDNNDGSELSPFLTISKALQEAYEAPTTGRVNIYLENGTYVENINPKNARSATSLLIGSKNSNANNVIIQGRFFSNEVGTKYILDRLTFRSNDAFGIIAMEENTVLQINGNLIFDTNATNTVIFRVRRNAYVEATDVSFSLIGTAARHFLYLDAGSPEFANSNGTISLPPTFNAGGAWIRARNSSVANIGPTSFINQTAWNEFRILLQENSIYIGSSSSLAGSSGYIIERGATFGGIRGVESWTVFSGSTNVNIQNAPYFFQTFITATANINANLPSGFPGQEINIKSDPNSTGNITVLYPDNSVAGVLRPGDYAKFNKVNNLFSGNNSKNNWELTNISQKAVDVFYDNTSSGLTATQTQEAIDILDSRLELTETELLYYDQSISLNVPASASGQNSIAIGPGANAIGTRSIAFGQQSSATNNAAGSIAIGGFSSNRARNSLALGTSATINSVAPANGEFSVALGSNASINNVSRAVQLSIGTNSVANTLQFLDNRLANNEGLYTSFTSPTNYFPVDDDNVTSHLTAIDSALKTANVVSAAPTTAQLPGEIFVNSTNGALYVFVDANNYYTFTPSSGPTSV